MKILYYSPHPNLNLAAPSGYGTHMREMIKAFKKLGHDVFPVIMGGTELKEIKPDKFINLKMVKRVIPSILWESTRDIFLSNFDRIAILHLEEQVRLYEPDLIYERSNYLQISGGLIAKKYGIKNILEINTPFVEERRNFQGNSFLLKRAFKNESLRAELSDKMAVVSSPLKKYFIEKHGISPAKIIIAPNAIDLEKIDCDKHSSVSDMEIQRVSSLLKNKTVVGFVGSIAKWHSVDILVQAFTNLVNRYPNTHLLIVGGGETMEELKQKTKDLGVSDRVIFTGNVEHSLVFKYIKLIDIAVLPNTNWYMSPIKIFEYGAMGKAIIAPDIDPIKDVIISGEDAVLIKSEVNTLENAIETLITNPDMRKQISANFREKVLKNYTWERIAQSILQS